VEYQEGEEYYKDALAHLNALQKNISMGIFRIVTETTHCYLPIYVWRELDSVWEDIYKEVVNGEAEIQYELIRNIYYGHTLICCNKGKANQSDSESTEDSCRYFITVLDQLHKLPYNQIPVYIMDGTGDIDDRYTDAEMFDVVKFERPDVHVDFDIYNEKTGKYYLQKVDNKEILCKGITKTIKEVYGFAPMETMVAGFKQIMVQMENMKAAGVTAYPPASYGNIVGRNDFRDCSILVKIGVLIMDGRSAFLIATSRHPELWEKIISLPDKKRTVLLSRIDAYTSKEEQEEEMTEDDDATTEKTENALEDDTEEKAISFMDSEMKKLQIEMSEMIDKVKLSQMLVDSVQEIFRLRIRKWNGESAKVIFLSRVERKNTGKTIRF